MPSPKPPAAGGAADVDKDPSVVVRKSQSDFRLLETGEFSDFTIACGDREWKVHKAILSKVPYFNATVGGGFKVQMHFGSLHKRSNIGNANEATKTKESVQEKINIEELFEPFEIQWLLSYIYFPHFDSESARLDTASKSYLETCVRLWQLGDYFQIETMSNLAKEKLEAGCDRWRRCSREVDTAKHGTTFIVDLESAVRQAWREDLIPGPLRGVLTKLCIDFVPYVRSHQSFFTLLQEVPQFAVTFSQLAMGSITSRLRLPKPSHVMEVDAPRWGPSPLSELVRRAQLDTEGLTRSSLMERARQTPSSPATARRVQSRKSIRSIPPPGSGEASD